MSYAKRLLSAAVDGAGPESSPDEAAALALQCHNASLRCRRRVQKTPDDLALEASLLAARIGRVFDEVESRDQWDELCRLVEADGLVPEGSDLTTSEGTPIDRMRLPLNVDNLSEERQPARDLNECLAKHLGVSKSSVCTEQLASAKKPRRPPTSKTLIERYQRMANELLRLLSRVGNEAVTLYCKQTILNGLVANRSAANNRRWQVALPSGKRVKLSE